MGLHEEFGAWPLAYIPWGGADFGEIRAVGKAVGDGDDAAFYDAWMRRRSPPGGARPRCGRS